MPDRWEFFPKGTGTLGPGMLNHPEGQWVTWDDAQTMVKAERMRVRAAIETVLAPEWFNDAEIETRCYIRKRLLKALDAEAVRDA